MFPVDPREEPLMTRRMPLVLATALLATLAACGTTTTSDTTSPPAAAGPAGAPGMGEMEGMEGMEGMQHGSADGLQLWAVQSGPLGVVVTDGSGHLLYRSDRDAPATSTCTDACAAMWEPVVTAGAAPELLGVDPTTVATLARAGGAQQVTLGGWPLYRRVGEATGLTDTGANGADGVWFAVRPDGSKA